MSKDRRGKASNFLQLSREFMNTPFYRDKGKKKGKNGYTGYTRGLAYIDLMFLTQHTTIQEFRNGELVIYQRGHIYHPIEEYATRWGWERRKVKRFLDQLQEDGEIEYTTSKRGTHIVMLKYEEWQGYSISDGTSDGISETIENTEDDAVCSISNGSTNGITDGKSDSASDGRSDSKQIIKNNNINNGINNNHDESRDRENPVGTRDQTNQYGSDSRLGSKTNREETVGTTELSEYADAIRKTSESPTEWGD